MFIDYRFSETDGDREIEKFEKNYTPYILADPSGDMCDVLHQVITPCANSSATAALLAQASAHYQEMNGHNFMNNRLLPARYARLLEQASSQMAQGKDLFAPTADNEQNRRLLTKLMNIGFFEPQLRALENQRKLREAITVLDEKAKVLAAQAKLDYKDQLKPSRFVDTSAYATASTSPDLVPGLLCLSPIATSPYDGQQSTSSSPKRKNSANDHSMKYAKKSRVESKKKPKRDLTHLLGARVYHYDPIQKANVLSIYTPQVALDAQNRRKKLLENGPGPSTYQLQPQPRPPSSLDEQVLRSTQLVTMNYRTTSDDGPRTFYTRTNSEGYDEPIEDTQVAEQACTSGYQLQPLNPADGGHFETHYLPQHHHQGSFSSSSYCASNEPQSISSGSSHAATPSPATRSSAENVMTIDGGEVYDETTGHGSVGARSNSMAEEEEEGAVYNIYQEPVLQLSNGLTARNDASQAENEPDMIFTEFDPEVAQVLRKMGEPSPGETSVCGSGSVESVGGGPASNGTREVTEEVNFVGDTDANLIDSCNELSYNFVPGKLQDFVLSNSN